MVDLEDEPDFVDPTLWPALMALLERLPKLTPEEEAIDDAWTTSMEDCE